MMDDSTAKQIHACPHTMGHGGLLARFHSHLLSGGAAHRSSFRWTLPSILCAGALFTGMSFWCSVRSDGASISSIVPSGASPASMGFGIPAPVGGFGIPSPVSDKPSVRGIRIEPVHIVLKGERAIQRLVVTADLSDGSEEDVTDRAAITISPGKAAALQKPFTLIPILDGAEQVKAAYAGHTAVADVSVENTMHHTPISFTNDMVPLFTKIGCNQGTCHGAASGQGGFHLSLRGYDPAFDWEQIVKENDGRRVDTQHPEASLVYRKPSGELSHGGGVRLPAGSAERALMLSWLLDGMPKPDDKVTLTDIIVSPTERMLPRPGMTQQILVSATYSDGTTRDVTQMSRFSSNDDSVAAVTPDGQVTAKSGGEAAIMVQYGALVKAPRIMVPIGQTAVLKSELPANNFIDDAVFEKIAQLRVHPSGLCTDPEYIRRVTLDITGSLPTEDEVTSFLKDPAVDKRSRLVDLLLRRPAYVDFRSLKLSDQLRVNSNFLKPEGAEAYYRWIHTQVAANTPWNQFVTGIIASRGLSFENGPTNYYRVATEPSLLAETTAQTFLGIRMQCCKCHNHPFERWTQNDYYGMAAFFARVGEKPGPEMDEVQIYSRTSGDVQHPRTKKIVEPRPLGSTDPIAIPDGMDRRVVLAQWLTTTAGYAVARAEVNRTWADFFGKGIIDPVDDVRVSNPPANDRLMTELTQQFLAHHWDIQWLIRTITASRTYQLSSELTPTNALDTRHFARALPRRLGAEQALDAVDAVTGRGDRFGDLPAGTRAVQLSDARQTNYFLQVFGKPKREVLCACERDIQPNLGQSLHMINGGDIQSKLTADNGWLHQQIKSGVDDASIIRDLYLRAVSRYPSPEEMRLGMAQLRPGVGAGTAVSGSGGGDDGTSGATNGMMSGKMDPNQAGRSAATGAMPAGSMPASATESSTDGDGGSGAMNAGAMNAGAMPAASMPGMAASDSTNGAGPSSSPVRSRIPGLVAPKSHPKPGSAGSTLSVQDRTAALEDIGWAILNSREFLFNH